ncbi:MAG: transcriptional regulator MraZ [Candidatus Parcubacteria bacterium]|jgi:MraZ protein|nr:transcriptional regulator MraZ [Candidatus Parcubacteria bacterium]
MSVVWKNMKWGTMTIKWEEVVRKDISHNFNFEGISMPRRSRGHMLIGQFNHTIDDKNRLSLPAKFREEMGKKVVITPGLDSCLFIFTVKQWEKISERLSVSESSMLQADNRGLNRYLLGGAVEVGVDAAGRMLLPEHLRSRAKLTNKVVFIGVRDRAELWDETAWNEYSDRVGNKADELAEKLGQAGMI